MHNALKHRNIKRLVKPEITTDGAGVTLRRSVGTRSLGEIDPFLLFDHFGSDNPDDYIAGFPMHPHRGIETVTYMLSGRIRHRDSVGNSGSIEAGGVQWMTAGRGIMHEEMPELDGGRLEGFQLWVNLRSDEKMLPPAYNEVSAGDVPTVEDSAGNQIKIIAGSYDGTEGAIRGISGAPEYLDVKIGAGGSFEAGIRDNASVFAYVYRGSIRTSSDSVDAAVYGNSPCLVIFDADGDHVNISAGDSGASLLLISGQPIGEPIARYGPFVMNTNEEIQTAIEELRNGTFIR